MIYTFAVLSPGHSVVDGIRGLVRLADKLEVGIETEANGIRIYVHPGDCADSLIETWDIVRKQGGEVVSADVMAKVMT